VSGNWHYRAAQNASIDDNKSNLPSHSRGSLEAALTEEASMTAAAAMMDTDFILVLLLSELV